MENALLDTYKKELEKYKTENYIYQSAIMRYKKLKVQPSEQEKYDEMMNEIFQNAYDEEQVKKDSDNKRVEELINRLSKPTVRPYIDDIIKNLSDIIDKIEEKT
jgi:hypothetical protein